MLQWIFRTAGVRDTGSRELSGRAWPQEGPPPPGAGALQGGGGGALLADAPRPANKYLTFRAYREAGPEEQRSPFPPRLICLPFRGEETHGPVPGWAVRRWAAAHRGPPPPVRKVKC